MAARNKPYEQFGTYILFKKLEADALGELWRAARIEGSQLGALVALRRLTGGNRQALHDAAMAARDVAPLLTGTSFAKNQVIDAIDGVPFLAHDYAGGRSLRHIIDRARGGNGVTPNPLPIDQAMVIAEKVALSLATTNDLRHAGNRLIHGALIPQFVWITDDGEIRVAGQGLGSGMLASLKDAKVGAELGRYFAPELHHGGEPSKATEVYAMGALLYVLVTGVEPPDATTASAFAQVIRAAKTTTGNPLPEDIRAILEKSLVVDPSARYVSIQDMKQALSALAHGGKYSASTFNLAFYVSNLMKKELEGEAIDREKENKLNITPYLEAPQPAAAPAAAAPAFAAQAGEPSRSKMPMVLAAAAVLAGISAGAYYFLIAKKDTKPSNAPAATVAATVPVPAPPRPQVVSQPLVAATPQTDSAATTDTAAQQKAFEQAVQQKLQEELMKLQADYTKQLQKQQSKNAPVPTPAPAVVENAPQQAETNAPSAAQLDQQRLAQRQEAAPAVPTPQPSAPQPTVQQAIQQQQPAPQQPAPQVATVREGDVVDVNNVDTAPRVTRAVQPAYPPMAMRQRLEATILISALVSERGDVIEVKVLRGDKRFGFEEAAIRAVRGTKFSPAVKDGKRVKTWFPLPVIFKL